MQVPPLSDQGLQDLLGQRLVAKIATTSANGDIRITPTVFAVEGDGSFRINTFENSTLVKNLRRNPRCSLLLDEVGSYPRGVDPGYGVHYWGTATVEGPKDDVEGMGRMFERYVDEGGLEAATEYAKLMVSYGTRVYVRFRPERSVTWDFRQG